MSPNEIIAMGNEAALQHGHTYEPEPGDGTIEFLGSFAALVAEKAAAKEREACALICEKTWVEPGDAQVENCHEAAASIRARGKP